MNYRIVPLDLEHVASLATRCRPEDAREFWCASGQTPGHALMDGFRSGSAMCGLADDLPLCAFGVSSASLLGGKTGVPWMIGTVDLDRHAAGFLRRCRPVVESMFSEFEVLSNYVDASNVRAIRWLKWLGFEFGQPEPYGWLDLPFIRFERRL